MGRKGRIPRDNDSDKPKYYTLIEFPYPSGQGLQCAIIPDLYGSGYRGENAA